MRTAGWVVPGWRGTDGSVRVRLGWLGLRLGLDLTCFFFHNDKNYKKGFLFFGF